MKRFSNRLFWMINLGVMIFIIMVIIWKLALGYADFESTILFTGRTFYIYIPCFLFFWFIYKFFIERILCHIGRKRSREILTDAEEIPEVCQVSGVIRSGKDASQTGAGILIREELIKRYKKELKQLIEKLYLYDFDELNSYISNNINTFMKSSKKAFRTVLIQTLKANDCFILQYYIDNETVNVHKHINSWIHRSGKQVPDVPFDDGVTIGGKHMLSLLERYIKVYVRITFIPNYLMTNQPIIEDYKVKRNGRISKLYSKIFSTDYISIKKQTPMPFVLGLIIIETETGIVYANTDKKLEEFIKTETGIKEFLTTEGHMLEEEGYMRAITQDKNRPNATLRELYQGYIHMFKMEFVATHDIFRLNYGVRRFRLKVLLFFLIMFKANIPGTKKFKVLIHKRYNYIRRRISKLHQKDLKVWGKGYIVFYQGVYKKINDAGKNVKYPILWGTREMKTKNSSYKMWGFKQFNRITDSFGRYNTHMMNSVREAKTEIYDMHFNDVDNWNSLNMTIEQMTTMKYPTIGAMNKAKTDYVESVLKAKRKDAKIKLSRQREPKQYDLSNLSTKELYNIALDYGVNLNKYKDESLKKCKKHLDPFMNTKTIMKMKLNNVINLCTHIDIGIDIKTELRKDFEKVINRVLISHHSK